MPGDIIPSKVICNEHHDVGRLGQDNDAAHQEKEEGGEQHGGGLGGQSGQLKCALHCPALLIAGLIFKRGGKLLALAVHHPNYLKKVHLNA